MAGLTEAIEAYLDFIQSSDRISETRDNKATALMGLLDDLAVWSRLPGICDPEAEDQEPAAPQMDLYACLGRNFPEFGQYNTVLDIDPNIDTKVAIGDAIDDMTDIAVDLTKALDIARRYGEDAGQYVFAFNYRIHWGFHLRNLQLYLFCQLMDF